MAARNFRELGLHNFFLRGCVLVLSNKGEDLFFQEYSCLFCDMYNYWLHTEPHRRLEDGAMRTPTTWCGHQQIETQPISQYGGIIEVYVEVGHGHLWWSHLILRAAKEEYVAATLN